MPWTVEMRGRGREKGRGGRWAFGREYEYLPDALCFGCVEL